MAGVAFDTEVNVFEDLRRAFIVIEDLLRARNTCWLIGEYEMFLSSTLPLNPPSSSLSRRQIVNPHCGAASGRALGPYFRGQIHHVWCGWCSHNFSLTGVMFAGIIQRSINTRAWRKYGAFIKTVNRTSFLQKPEEKKRITGFPRNWGLRCYIAHAIWHWQKKCHQKQQQEASLLKRVKKKHFF